MTIHLRSDLGDLRIDGAHYRHHGYRDGRHDIRHGLTGLPFGDGDAGAGLLDDLLFDELFESGRLVIASSSPCDRAPPAIEPSGDRYATGRSGARPATD